VKLPLGGSDFVLSVSDVSAIPADINNNAAHVSSRWKQFAHRKKSGFPGNLPGRGLWKGTIEEKRKKKKKRVEKTARVDQGAEESRGNGNHP